MHQKRAPKIRLALNRNSRTRLDVLRQEFRKDDLLGEEFRPDYDSGPLSLRAGGNQTNHAEHRKEADVAHESRIHVWPRYLLPSTEV